MPLTIRECLEILNGFVYAFGIIALIAGGFLLFESRKGVTGSKLEKTLSYTMCYGIWIMFIIACISCFINLVIGVMGL